MPVASAEAVLASAPREDAAVAARALPAPLDVAGAELRAGQLPADRAPVDLVAPQAADWVRVDSVARQADAPALPLDDSSQDDSVEPPSAGSILADSPELLADDSPAASLWVRAAPVERQAAVPAGPQAVVLGAEQLHEPQPVVRAGEQARGLWSAQPVSQEAQPSPLDALRRADAN